VSARSEDGGLGFGYVAGDLAPQNGLLQVIVERIRAAAERLGLTRADLFRIFSRHSVFEAEAVIPTSAGPWPFLVVETHHLIQGKVGKGALKIVFPHDLIGQGPHFREAAAGAVAVVPPAGRSRWASQVEADEVVRHALREFMTGESLSMSLKCQATGAPFAGSEGLLLCAHREFDPAAGSYHLRPALEGTEAGTDADRERIEAMMNAAAELLTRSGRIAYDRIVHAAETNSTLTARLNLQLPTNVLEGHLRALLEADAGLIIGDEDMTPRLRSLLADPAYRATGCLLARTAAQMQIEHSVLRQSSRERLRQMLGRLPGRGFMPSALYRELADLLFGTGEIQQTEDRLYHRREGVLKPLSVVFSVGGLDTCGDPQVLELFLKTLLDNERVIMEAVLTESLPRGYTLPSDWVHSAMPLAAADEATLGALFPPSDASRETVREHFWQTVRVLAEARARIVRHPSHPFADAQRIFLERAMRAILASGELTPSVDRVLFFMLPYTLECVTPRLGVVTRKPVAVCGSELRPEAMAVGAVMTIEILFKRRSSQARPLEGLTVAIEGLGNAGKNVAALLAKQGARIVAVSDRSGALLDPQGFAGPALAAIIQHKEAGRRLNTLPVRPPAVFDPNPERLKSAPAELLVLSAFAGSVHAGNAGELPARVICELTGAAVTGDARTPLQARGVTVIPDNLASAGGLLVSLSEMLQNSAGQNWDRTLEEANLYGQLAAAFDHAAVLAETHQVGLAEASDMLALDRMHRLALYRERLEAAAAQLQARIESIRPDERVLLLSDNDEDGVASAAILLALMGALRPESVRHVTVLNESFRAKAVLDHVRAANARGVPVRHIFAVDRAFPLHEPAHGYVRTLAERCRITVINNHELPPEALALELGEGAVRSGRWAVPADLGILLLSPQTLRSVLPAREFLTALVLRELARQLVSEEATLARIDWQAAVGSILDLPADRSQEWVLFFSRFNPDHTLEAARAIRLVARANGFQSAVTAMTGVVRPDQLRTNEAWNRFMAAYETLRDRVQALVERILVENRRKPFTAHFFTEEELTSPTSLAGDDDGKLDFYHWISEHLTQHGHLADQPIIMGQVVREHRGEPRLGVRIRSPRGCDLMRVGLPPDFVSAGLPHTAIARLPLDDQLRPEDMFQRLIEVIWEKTTIPPPTPPG